MTSGSWPPVWGKPPAARPTAPVPGAPSQGVEAEKAEAELTRAALSGVGADELTPNLRIRIVSLEKSVEKLVADHEALKSKHAEFMSQFEELQYRQQSNDERVAQILREMPTVDRTLKAAIDAADDELRSGPAGRQESAVVQSQRTPVAQQDTGAVHSPAEMKEPAVDQSRRAPEAQQDARPELGPSIAQRGDTPVGATAEARRSADVESRRTFEPQPMPDRHLPKSAANEIVPSA